MVRMIEFLAMGLFLLAPNVAKAEPDPVATMNFEQPIIYTPEHPSYPGSASEAADLAQAAMAAELAEAMAAIEPASGLESIEVYTVNENGNEQPLPSNTQVFVDEDGTVNFE